MLDKLLESNMEFISTVDKKWLKYISINLCDTIHHITQYLKTNLLKILFIRLTASNFAHLNKTWQTILTFISSFSTLYLSTCKNLIYLTKKTLHIVDKYWEIHFELHPIYSQNSDSSKIKIKGIVSSQFLISDLPIFETSWLLKIIVIKIPILNS